jgi:hypothetical protein
MDASRRSSSRSIPLAGVRQKVSAVPPDRHPEPGFSLANEIVDFLVKIPTI